MKYMPFKNKTHICKWQQMEQYCPIQRFITIDRLIMHINGIKARITDIK